MEQKSIIMFFVVSSNCFLLSIAVILTKVWVWVYWCFMSHATIFQLYMWRHRCAGGLKKLYLRSGSQRHRHYVGFFNVPVLHRQGTTLLYGDSDERNEIWQSCITNTPTPLKMYNTQSNEYTVLYKISNSSILAWCVFCVVRWRITINSHESESFKCVTYA